MQNALELERTVQVVLLTREGSLIFDDGNAIFKVGISFFACYKFSENVRLCFRVSIKSAKAMRKHRATVS